AGGQSKESTFETNLGVCVNEVDDDLCRRARGHLCVCAVRAGARAPSPSWPASCRVPALVAHGLSIESTGSVRATKRIRRRILEWFASTNLSRRSRRAAIG